MISNEALIQSFKYILSMISIVYYLLYLQLYKKIRGQIFRTKHILSICIYKRKRQDEYIYTCYGAAKCFNTITGQLF